MDAKTIEAEVRRLAPWYYRYDLGGVSTDICDPCDRHGFRTAELPAGYDHVWKGRTVLDAGCNEGAYSFAALRAGAASATGFDCREVNVEKARFVASVFGFDHAEFHVASCDSWLESSDERFDLVFLCGLLYHLPEPWRTIEQYCARARHGLFVTCVLTGGDDGYTDFAEQENIAASENAAMSRMPNTATTLIRAFVKQGFAPSFVFEDHSGDDYGGCRLVMTDVRPWSGCTRTVVPDLPDHPFGLYLTPRAVVDPGSRRAPFDLDVVMHNRSAEVQHADTTLTVQSESGAVLHRHGPQSHRFPAWTAYSVPAFLELPEDEPVTLDLSLEDPQTRRLVARELLIVDPVRLATVQLR